MIKPAHTHEHTGSGRDTHKRSLKREGKRMQLGLRYLDLPPPTPHSFAGQKQT